MIPDSTTFLPSGDQPRLESVCLALVGPHRVSSRWAFQAMNLHFPVMARRTMLCFVNDNLDVARNLALDEWRKAKGDLKTDWLAIVAAESFLRSDAIATSMVASDPVTRIGESYVLRRSAIETVDPPWFASGAWRGPTSRDRTEELSYDLVGAVRQDVRQPFGRLEEQDDSAAPQLITIGIPTLGTVALPWVVNAVVLMSPMTCTISLVAAENFAVATARQRIADTVLTARPRPAYLLFWGDDNLPPPDGLRLLLDTARRHDAPAVSGLYHVKAFPPVQPVMWRHGHPGPLIVGRDFAVGDIIQVDGSGLDFVLIRTDALAALPPLKFRTVLDWVEDRGMVVQTEDAFFWDRWREVHGKGPLVDTRCRVGHYSLHDGAVY